MSKINDISSAIKTKLESLDSLSYVYDTIEANSEWYPCVRFEPDTLDNVVQDTCNNLRTLSFEALLLQELSNITPIGWNSKRRQGYLILENAYSEIIDIFDNDFTLGWICEGWVEPIKAQFWEVNLDTWDLLFVKFTIKCSYIYNTKI